MPVTRSLSLYDVHTQLAPIAETPVPAAVHHILVVDCSGSMWGNLSELRQHLKAKLLSLVSNGDTLTLIWFSSRGEYGVVFEAIKVSTLDDLTNVHRQIDRELVGRGATGFKEPIEEATRIAKKLTADGGVVNFFFLSDGCENCWPRHEVFKAVDALRLHTKAATVVEYGAWADRQMLLTMAEKLGGNHVYSRSFEDYRVAVERSVSVPVMLSAKPMTLEDTSDIHGGVAVAFLADGSAVALEVRDGAVLAPVGTVQVAWVTKRDNLPKRDTHALQHAVVYHLAATFALRGDAQVTRDLLGYSGDVELIDLYTNAFGKEAIWAFAQKARSRAALSPEAFKAVSLDPNYMPPTDAVTIPQLLGTLEMFGAKVLDPEIGYKKIGRAKVDANLRLAPEELAEVDRLTSLMKGEKDVHKVSELAAQIDAITNKPAPLRFVNEPTEGPAYFSLEAIVLNEDRPNISLRVRRPGSVDISDRIPENLKGKLPEVFPTYVWRTYTLVRDGFVNMEEITVALGELELGPLVASLDKLAFEKRLRKDAYTVDTDAYTITFSLRNIPLINAMELEKPSATEVAAVQAVMLEKQASLKVAKALLNEKRPEKTLGFSALYGEEAAAFLASIGITDGGFHPRVLQADSTDSYQAKVLELKLKGFSSLPSVDKVRAQVEAKKVPAVSQLMASALDELSKLSAEELEKAAKALTKSVRGCQHKLARLKYPALVGGAWYFNSFDEKTTPLTFPNHKLSAELTFELKEVTEKI